ncbi:MAG: peptide deformylase, partial [Methyloceanibacter sp.]
SEPQVYVNPVIISKSTWGIVEESCASIPDVVGNVIRATKVHVRAQDRHGDAFERVLTDMDAVCIQHEIDHLNGKLFIDRLSFFRKLALRSRLRAKVRRHNNAA